VVSTEALLLFWCRRDEYWEWLFTFI